MDVYLHWGKRTVVTLPRNEKTNKRVPCRMPNKKKQMSSFEFVPSPHSSSPRGFLRHSLCPNGAAPVVGEQQKGPFEKSRQSFQTQPPPPRWLSHSFLFPRDRRFAGRQQREPEENPELRLLLSYYWTVIGVYRNSTKTSVFFALNVLRVPVIGRGDRTRGLDGRTTGFSFQL